MKQLVIFVLALLLGAGTTLAQEAEQAPESKAERPRVRRFEIGVRGGINFADYSFTSVRLGGTHFSPGPIRAGYDVGLVVRLNLSRHLHLQSELNYAFVNYAVRASGTHTRTLTLRTERLEIPVQLGFQFGALRLFGGVQFRVADSQHSDRKQLLRIGFNDNDLAIMGGAGLRFHKFFLEFRVSGYPRAHVWHEFTSEGLKRRVKAPHDLVYGGSLGFFF